MLFSTALLISALLTVGSNAAGGVKGRVVTEIKSPSFEPQVKEEGSLSPFKRPLEEEFEEEEEIEEEVESPFRTPSRPFVPSRPAVPSRPVAPLQPAAPRRPVVSSLPNFIEPPPAPRPEPIAEVLANYNPPEPYSFGYNANLEDGSSSGRREVSTGERVEGSYELASADGYRRVVHYVADQDGFRAYVDTNEPGTYSGAPAGVMMKSTQLSGDELSRLNEPNRIKNEAVLSQQFPSKIAEGWKAPAFQGGLKNVVQPQKIQTWRAPRVPVAAVTAPLNTWRSEVKAPISTWRSEVKAPVVNTVPVVTWTAPQQRPIAAVKEPAFRSIPSGVKSVPLQTWTAPRVSFQLKAPAAIRTWTAPVAPTVEVKAPAFNGGLKSGRISSWKAEVKAPSFGGLKSRSFVPRPSKVQGPVLIRSKTVTGDWSRPVSFKVEIPQHEVRTVPVQAPLPAKAAPTWAVKSLPVIKPQPLKNRLIALSKHTPATFAGLKGRTLPVKTIQQPSSFKVSYESPIKPIQRPVIAVEEKVDAPQVTQEKQIRF